MAYKLSLKDLEYYVGRHDEILPKDILDLRYHVLPKSNGSGFVAGYTQPDKRLALLIDEREDKDYLFIGGILLAIKDLKKLKDFINNFKLLFRPELEPRKWFLKGSGAWIQEGNQQEENRSEALTRWILWSKNLKKLTSYYQIHGTTLVKKKFIPKSSKRKKANIERYREAYTKLFETLEQHRYSQIEIITDNLQGSQLKGLNESFEEHKNIDNFNLNKLSVLPKEDYSSENSCALQFVDMLIYSISRFICPSCGNILMDFENFALFHGAENNKKTLNISNDLDLHIAASRYYIIGDMYHILRQKIVKNLLSPNFEGPISSMNLITNLTYRNFGSDVDAGLQRFCWGPKNAKNFDINSYK